MPDEDQELTDEAVQPGDTDRGQHHDGEDAGQHRRPVLQAAQMSRTENVSEPPVDHRDEQEQRRGVEAVVDHLQHRARDRLAA